MWSRHAIIDVESGFSLIEVLMAMALLGLSASVLLGSQIAAVHAAQRESLRSEAAGIAQAVDVRRLPIPIEVCDASLSSALGFEVSEGLCATSDCTSFSCEVVVKSRSGEAVWGSPP